MRIAMDATPMLGTRTGVGTFTAGAMDALARRGDLDVVGYALSWRARAELLAELPHGVRPGRSMAAAVALNLWRWTDLLGSEFLAGAADVVHGTNFVVPPSRRAARVVTVHDLTSVRFPELCTPASLRYPDLIRRATRSGAWVHTPSEYVAAEVCDLLGVSPERVRAVAHGIGPPQDHADADAGAGSSSDAGAGSSSDAGRAAVPCDSDAGADSSSDAGGSAVACDSAGPAAGRRLAGPAAGRRLAGGEQYVLALGTVEPRKDYPLLVRAFDEVAAGRPDLRLVIAGPDGWGAEALDEAIAGASARARIVRVGYVDGPTRSALLAGATVFAFPSLYEGFGLPPLEAMTAGVPVVATAAGAVVEVVGDAAQVVAVGDSGALAAALAGVIDDESLAADLVSRGHRRAGAFTWSRCADGLVELYRAAIAASAPSAGRDTGSGRGDGRGVAT